MLTPLDAARQHRVNLRGVPGAPRNRAGAAEARRRRRREKQGDAGDGVGGGVGMRAECMCGGVSVDWDLGRMQTILNQT